MNWIKQNTFLSGVLAILILGGLALGYFFMKARGEYAAAKDRLADAYSAKKALESKKPFPESANEDEVRKLVSTYRADAESLMSKMLASQAPMPSGTRVARFQEDLALKVDAVVSAAEAAGVTLPEGFYLGMEKYQTQVPLDDAVDDLQFQLNASARLAELLLANDVSKFGIKRQAMPFEQRQAAPRNNNNNRGRNQRTQAPKKEEVPTSVVYPMELVVEMSPKGFQKVMNALSNTQAALPGGDDIMAVSGEDSGEYYFVTRFMGIENETPFAPEKSQEPDDEPEAAEEDADEDAFGAADGEGLNMVFGTEKVRAYLALDLVRFVKPEVAAADTKPAE